MNSVTRRTFLTRSASVAGAACLALDGGAFPLSLPIGIQSFDLTNRLRADFDGTLKTLAGYGFQWIDWLAGGRTTVPAVAAMPAREVHQRFVAAGGQL